MTMGVTGVSSKKVLHRLAEQANAVEFPSPNKAVSPQTSVFLPGGPLSLRFWAVPRVDDEKVSYIYSTKRVFTVPSHALKMSVHQQCPAPSLPRLGLMGLFGASIEPSYAVFHGRSALWSPLRPSLKVGVASDQGLTCPPPLGSLFRV